MLETIAAIATPAGRGGVGIVRLSGPHAGAIAAKIAGALPEARHASLRRFLDERGEPLDEGLVLFFPAPNSLTGEDVIELQGHGGPIVLSALLQACCTHGARVARPGEFSERAFLNGRIDLAQAEAIADLVDAASREAARAAHRSMQGELSSRVNALRDTLTGLRVHIEGAIDFSDEDIETRPAQILGQELDASIDSLRDLLRAAAQGRRLREGLIVAIAGQPNVGKSTLLNRLAGADVAIVAEVAGTTRDVLREDIVIDGLPLTVVDTAGLRETADPVEQEGVRRAWRMLEQAELILFLIDDRSGVTRADEDLLERLPCGAETLIVRNKCDLSYRAAAREIAASASETSTSPERLTFRVSAHSGEGLELLTEEIKRVAGLSSGTQGLFSARARHVQAMEQALAHLLDAQRNRDRGATVDVIAEDLRLAHQALGEITGAFTSEDLLGAIFARFCIGK